MTFNDSVGEDPAAPDVTTIVVSNDDAATLSFKINIPNRAQYAADVALIMFLDSDANQATGDPESLGADFIIQLIQGEILALQVGRLRLHAERDAGIAFLRLGERADGPDQCLGPQQHEEASLRHHGRVGHRLRPDHWRHRLHQLQA